MNIKKLFTCLLALALITMSFSACGNSVNPDTSGTQSESNTEKISVVSTIFPQYDWVRQILGEKTDNVELTLLLDNGVDLHSYQPSVEDIATISTCDMFIYVGGDSDEWVHDVLKTATNKDMVVINLLEVLGDSVKEEEIVEGMEHDHDHGHSHGEISPEDVNDRPLSDWNGEWVTIENALQAGDFDDYVTHNAEENELSFDEQKNAYAERWKSDYETFAIAENTIRFNDDSVEYTYIGYKLVESDHGTSVWYGFESESGDTTAPKYIAFNDHGTGGEHEHEEHEEDSTAHFHMRYGNESFDALVNIENWSPTFFPNDATGEEIAETMSGHSHSHEGELDEHVWLSLKNAQVLCSYISNELGKIDAQNAEVYAANAGAYNTKLGELDAQYLDVVNSASYDTLLFGDRFPFRYLVDDYGLNYYAAFSGCSAETEASFETIVFLADKTDELNLNHILVIESSDQSIAKTIVENTGSKNQSIVVMDSIQSVTANDISAGATYLSIMENNLNALAEALS